MFVKNYLFNTKMYSSESDSEVEPEEDEEGKLYEFIFELDEKEQNEEFQIPSRKSPVQVEVSADGTVENGTVPLTKCHYTRGERQRNNSSGNDRRGRHVHASATRDRVSDRAVAGRPWREPGAVTSDFFNYGFDEDSWKLYQKHGRFCSASGRPTCSGPVHQGRSAPEERAHRHTPPGGASPPRASRRPIDADVTGGRAGRRGTVRGPRTLEDQVHTSPDEDGFSFLHRSSPPDFGSLFAIVPPPQAFLQRPSNRSCPHESGHSKGPEDPSLHQRSSGASSLTGAGPFRYHDRDRPRAHDRCERDERSRSSSHRGERRRLDISQQEREALRAAGRKRRRKSNQKRRSQRSRDEGEERRGSYSSRRRRSTRDGAKDGDRPSRQKKAKRTKRAGSSGSQRDGPSPTA
ncbi:pre-mRNA 3'-end-processing factor FIP1 isoform X2 [Pungitius pungitius]|uniref:pre-mRNA 3'-end-processing factor FIP1 isoform X2 n=1 Tax=Pungitius pungitius TaxID=134920 RepID=UPI002E1226C9